MKRKYDATVITGEYQNNAGETKKRYLTIGSVLERGDGSLCMKLEAVPVNFDGWINFYTPKLKELGEKIGKIPTRSEMEDEIPF